MDTITKDYIEKFAPDSSTIKNAQSLVKKGSFQNHGKNTEDTLYFAECKGSGKTAYKVSADFLKENQPLFRCSCPSRKLPCKHSIALLFEILEAKEFPVAEIPEDLARKREKQVKKIEKAEAQKDEPKKPKKINKSARVKKMQKQLQGLELVETFLNELLTTGIENIDKKSNADFQAFYKELGNYYLSAPQTYINDLHQFSKELQWANSRKQQNNTPFNEQHIQTIYANIFQTTIKLNHLIQKSRTFLNEHIANNNGDYINDELVEALGTAWKLEELNEMGLCKENAELVELTFYVKHTNSTEIDTAYYIDLETGAINPTYQYRTEQAMRFMTAEDCHFDVTLPKMLSYYPAQELARIRFEDFTTRPLTTDDMQKIKSFALDIKTATKKAKHYFKNILSKDVYPIIITYQTLGKANNNFYLQDLSGSQIQLFLPKPQAISPLAQLPSSSLYQNQVMFGELVIKNIYEEGNLIEENVMQFIPRSILSDSQIVRL